MEPVWMRRFAACTSMATTFAPELHKTNRKRRNTDQRGNMATVTAIWCGVVSDLSLNANGFFNSRQKLSTTKVCMCMQHVDMTSQISISGCSVAWFKPLKLIFPKTENAVERSIFQRFPFRWAWPVGTSLVKFQTSLYCITWINSTNHLKLNQVTNL